MDQCNIEVTSGSAGFTCDELLVITRVETGGKAEAGGVKLGMSVTSFMGEKFTDGYTWSELKGLAKMTPKPWAFGFGLKLTHLTRSSVVDGEEPEPQPESEAARAREGRRLRLLIIGPGSGYHSQPRRFESSHAHFDVICPELPAGIVGDVDGNLEAWVAVLSASISISGAPDVLLAGSRGSAVVSGTFPHSTLLSWLPYITTSS